MNSNRSDKSVDANSSPPPLPVKNAISTRRFWRLVGRVICIAVIIVSACIIGGQLRSSFFSDRVARKTLSFSPELILHQPVVHVPLLLEGRPFVDVMVNNRGPHRFLLDTGATNIHVSQHLVEELNLPVLDDTATETTATGDIVECQLVHVRSLKLGEVETMEFVAYMHPNREIREQHCGVIGSVMFRKLLLTLDFSARQMRIERGSLPPSDGKEIFQLVPGASSPTVQVSVGDEPMELIIDTGGTWGINVPETVSKSLSFSSDPFEQPVGTTSGIFISKSARMAGEMRIGRHCIENPIISWFPGKTGHKGIGMKVLRHFVLTLDLTNQIVRFARNDKAAIKISGYRTIGMTFNIKNGVGTIGTISPATPAAHLDVKVGDEVLTVNGERFNEFTDSKWKRFIKDMSVVTFELKRHDKQFTVDVPIVERP